MCIDVFTDTVLCIAERLGMHGTCKSAVRFLSVETKRRGLARHWLFQMDAYDTRYSGLRIGGVSTPNNRIRASWHRQNEKYTIDRDAPKLRRNFSAPERTNLNSTPCTSHVSHPYVHINIPWKNQDRARRRTREEGGGFHS